jgi:DNA-binding MarR family transcriptional regulator
MILVYKKKPNGKPARKLKTPKQLERYFKGVANHWRIEILDLIAKKEGITLENISETLDCNLKTISEHTRKLVQAGLVNKKYKGREVMHSLSPYGQRFLKFIKTF